MSVDAAVAQMDEQAALPRRNGELVFEAPWESRVFGMAVAMHEAGLFEWDDFRERLVEEIGLRPGEGGEYYESWLAAFEGLLFEHFAVSEDEIDARAHALAEGDVHPHSH